MTDIGSRRAFLTRAWREALTAAPKVTSAVLPGVKVLAQTDAQPAATADATGFADPRLISATPVQEIMTVDELLRMADELGLADHRESLQALARASVRLVPGAPGAVAGRSRLGQELVQIDLAELTSLGVRSGLPLDGVLRFQCDMWDQAARWGRAHVVHVPEPDEQISSSTAAASTPSPSRLQLSVELSLPRVWSAPVEALGLDESQQESWQQLRLWLAGRQGVELFDDVDGVLVAHRLFGYPDERTGEMPLLCELLGAELEVDDHPLAHPLATRLAPLAGRWRLLLQVSAADGLIWPWSRRYERLYFWIDEHRLEVGDLSDVVVVAQ
jgi:hypothetical protein